MPLALEPPQIVMMLIGFAGMAGFGGAAVWLVMRRNGSNRSDAAREQTQPGAVAAPAPEPAPAPVPAHAPELHEPTEFVALPNHREEDSPVVDDGTAFIEPAFAAAIDPLDATRLAAPAVDDAPAPEKTDLIPSPLAGWQRSATAEATSLVQPSSEATGFVPSPALPPAEPTSLMRPPSEATAFLPAPAPAEPTSLMQPPYESTAFVPSPALPPTEPTSLMPSPAPAELRAFVSPPAPPPAEPSVSLPRVPTPEPTRVRPMTPSVDVDEHLRHAIEAFERIQTGKAEPGAREALDGHLAVLASAPADELLQRLRADGPALREQVLLLALLHGDTWPARTALGPMLDGFDAARRETALQLLRSWDDPRASSIAGAALAAASSSEQRAMWLRCFADRGWDPGADAIEAALDDDDAAVLVAGLRLLARPDRHPHLQSRLTTATYAPDPRVRMQAIEAALASANQSAWLMCRQLARNPSFPVAAELVALLGSEAEVAALCQSLDAEALPALLRALALSGRPVALRRCVARFDDPDADLREAARAGLALANGRSFADAAAARDWLDGLDGATRWLGGRPRTGVQVIEALRNADVATRRALARELSIRSRGRIHVDAELLPDAMQRQLDGVQAEVDGLDLDRGFPW